MTAADYAAIAVAPVLIFLMISSLANFLMLVFYQGPNPLRVAWIVSMFTMGFVGIARIAIEQDRAHSMGYAAVLGVAGFFAMTRFVGSPILCALILGLIAYLADRIVDDCTLIDDSVDSSGQGLIDFGKKAMKRHVELTRGAQRKTSGPTVSQEQAEAATAKESVTASPGDRGRKSQPGRTVLYLSLAALPLFGLGQFLLHDDSMTWQRAQWLLALYLFSCFSLLVTTSFLGLRRYLRQRGVEMPANVSIGWLAGGVVMTAAIISLAYFVPLPGQTIASVQMPDWLNSPDDFAASKFGWGKEGAAKSRDGDASTAEDPKSEGKQTQSIRPQEGAPPGDSGDGKAERGPPGKQQGGKKSPGDQSTSASKSESKDTKQASQESSSQETKSDSEPDDSQQSEGDQSQKKQPEAEKSASEKPEQKPEQKSEQNPEQRSDSGSTRGNRPPPPSPRGPSMFESLFSGLGNVFKFILVIVLAGMVGGYLWTQREAIAAWWRSLFDRPDLNASIGSSSSVDVDASEPPRPFSSFRNPIGHEQDPRRVMVITFQAFEAWTRERGWTREKDETPSEFLQRVAGSVPHMSVAATNVVHAYNRIVYGRGRPTKSDIDAAQAVWQAMR